MNITIKNQDEGIRSYLGGIVTVPEGGQTTIARDLNVIVVSDSQFLSDIINRKIIINTGVDVDLTPREMIELSKVFANFSTDKLATMFLYYSSIVNVRHTANVAVGTTIWSMRNPLASPLNAVIESIELKGAFAAATPIFRNMQRYELLTFSAATPTGGTQITPLKASKLSPASGIDVRQSDSGLAVSGVSFDSPFGILAIPATDGAIAPYERKIPLKLAPGEGLAIRVSDVQAVSQQGVFGEIVWSLR
jgi:hypothetical protein